MTNWEVKYQVLQEQYGKLQGSIKEHKAKAATAMGTVVKEVMEQRIAEAEARTEAAERRATRLQSTLELHHDNEEELRKEFQDARTEWHTEHNQLIREAQGANDEEHIEFILQLEKQLAEAQERLDSAGVVGIYDEFASIPDAVYQMARHIKDLERQLAEQAERIVELETDLQIKREMIEMLEKERR